MESQENGRRGLTGGSGRGMAVRHGTLRIDLRPGLARLCAVAAQIRGPETADSNTGTLRAAATLAPAALRSKPACAGASSRARPDADGSHPLVVESTLAQPTFTLPAGEYVVHVAFGLASATRGVTLRAGELRDEMLPHFGRSAAESAARSATRRSIPPSCRSRYTCPSATTSQAQARLRQGAAGDVIGVPEGTYHIVSTYLDTVGVGTLASGQGRRRRRQRARADEFDRLRRRAGSPPARSSTSMLTPSLRQRSRSSW